MRGTSAGVYINSSITVEGDRNIVGYFPNGFPRAGVPNGPPPSGRQLMNSGMSTADRFQAWRSGQRQAQGGEQQGNGGGAKRQRERDSPEEGNKRSK